MNMQCFSSVPPGERRNLKGGLRFTTFLIYDVNNIGGGGLVMTQKLAFPTHPVQQTVAVAKAVGPVTSFVLSL
jgi:hypothetical protein